MKNTLSLSPKSKPKPYEAENQPTIPCGRAVVRGNEFGLLSGPDRRHRGRACRQSHTADADTTADAYSDSDNDAHAYLCERRREATDPRGRGGWRDGDLQVQGRRQTRL